MASVRVGLIWLLVASSPGGNQSAQPQRTAIIDWQRQKKQRVPHPTSIKVSLTCCPSKDLLRGRPPRAAFCGTAGGAGEPDLKSTWPQQIRKAWTLEEVPQNARVTQWSFCGGIPSAMHIRLQNRPRWPFNMTACQALLNPVALQGQRLALASSGAWQQRSTRQQPQVFLVSTEALQLKLFCVPCMR